MAEPVDRQPAQVPQSEIARIYDRVAPVYDLWSRLTATTALARGLSLAAVRDGETVVEAGVGTGGTFRELVRQNPTGRTIGLDLSPNMLARARRKLTDLPADRYQLSLGDAAALDLPDASVDLVFSAYMLDLMDADRIAATLAEFRRVLRPDGRLAVVGMTRPERPLAGVYGWLARVAPRLFGGCRPLRLRPGLEAAGFAPAVREYRQQMLFPSEVILAHPRG